MKLRKSRDPTKKKRQETCFLSPQNQVTPILFGEPHSRVVCPAEALSTGGAPNSKMWHHVCLFIVIVPRHDCQVFCRTLCKNWWVKEIPVFDYEKASGRRCQYVRAGCEDSPKLFRRIWRSRQVMRMCFPRSHTSGMPLKRSEVLRSQ